MHKCGVAYNGNCFRFSVGSQSLVKTVEPRDGSAHADSGVHGRKGSGGRQGITANIAHNIQLVFRQDIEEPPVWAAGTEHWRTPRHGLRNRLIFPNFHAKGFGNQVLGEFIAHGENLFACDIEPQFAAMVFNYRIQFFYDVKLVNFRFNPDGTGNFWILDGQHTLTVEKELGHETLTCKVFIGLSQKEEAKLFSKQNEFRRSITAFAQFKAEVVAEMKPAVDIKNLCDKYHIEIKQARGMVPANTITSVRKLYNIVNKFGIEGLDFTLQTIIELGWNKVEAGMNEKVLSIYVAYPYCKDNATNYSKLKATLGSFENPQKMTDFATDKYRDEAKVQTKCVEMFVENIF